MLNEGQNKLFQVLNNYIPSGVFKTKNTSKTWLYGYNEKYDLVIISKTGRIGKVISINGLIIGIPPEPKEIHQRSKDKKEQYWEREELPRDLSRITSIFQWNDRPSAF